MGSTVPWKLSRTTSSSAAAGELEERPLADRRGGEVAARGVDEDVDAPEALEHGRARLLELGAVEHVGLEDERGLAELCASASSGSRRRASRPTRAPAPARPRAIAPPRTPDAPVTTATRSSRPNSSESVGWATRSSLSG